MKTYCLKINHPAGLLNSFQGFEDDKAAISHAEESHGVEEVQDMRGKILWKRTPPTPIEELEKLTVSIDRGLYHIHGGLSYWDLVDKITKLANLIHDYGGETEDWLYLNEFGNASPDAILVGAYWHAVEWHGGQDCPVYAMQCAIGQVFSPGMTDGPEPGSSEEAVWMELSSMATEERS